MEVKTRIFHLPMLWKNSKYGNFSTKNRLTELLISYCIYHVSNANRSTLHTLAQLRLLFWIPKDRVKRTINKYCMVCKKMECQTIQTARNAKLFELQNPTFSSFPISWCRSFWAYKH